MEEISLYGDIHNWIRWGYTYDEYIRDKNCVNIPRNVIKVFSGR
jgi:hypothetical protein